MVAAKPYAIVAGADAAVEVIAELAANASSQPNAENAQHKRNMPLWRKVPNAEARLKPKCRRPRSQ
jgi:hypothetical protein